MRDILEHLLQSVDVPNPERAQLHWDEYRSGAVSPDPAVKAAADAAFAALLAWYGGSLYRHIWGFIRTDQAEDVFQDVLRKLHEKRQSPRLADFHANVLPWLRTVAIRECVDAHRRTARRRGRESRAARPEQHPPSDNPGELQEVLSVALARLTREEQQAIALHYFEGHDKQETALILGVHRDTLATRLNTALDRLQLFVPAPAGILVGGSLAVPTALAARPPALSATRLGELVASAWTRAAPQGWPVAKTACVAAALVIGSGLALGGLMLTRETQPPLTVSQPLLQDPAPPEKLQARNLRLFNTEVRQKLIEALRISALGEGGTAEITRVAAYDTRIECDAIIRHGSPNSHVTRLNILHDAAGGEPRFLLDLRGDGQWRGIDPHRPIVLQNPINGKLMTFRLATTDKALEAFMAVPWADERLAAEAAARLESVRRAALLYEGDWCLDGNATKPIRVWWSGPDEYPGLWFSFPDGGKNCAPLMNLEVGPDGRLSGIHYLHQFGVLSPDAQRIDFPGTGHWWTRNPGDPGAR